MYIRNLTYYNLTLKDEQLPTCTINKYLKLDQPIKTNSEKNSSCCYSILICKVIVEVVLCIGGPFELCCMENHSSLLFSFHSLDLKFQENQANRLQGLYQTCKHK